MDTKLLVLSGLILILLVSGCSSQQNAPSQQPGQNTGAQVSIPTPRAAFEGYRKALTDKNLDSFLKYVSTSSIQGYESKIGKLDQNSFNTIAYYASMLPSVGNVVVVTENIQGDTATWAVSDKTDSRKTGTITFVKENGQWKLNKEQWTQTN